MFVSDSVANLSDAGCAVHTTLSMFPTLLLNFV